MLIKYFKITDEEDFHKQYKGLVKMYSDVVDSHILKQINEEASYISLNKDKIFSKQYKHIFNVVTLSNLKDSTYPIKLFRKKLKELKYENELSNYKPMRLLFAMIENADHNKYVLELQHFQEIAEVLGYKEGWAFHAHVKYKNNV